MRRIVTVARTVTFEPTGCAACGVTFGVTEELLDHRRGDHQSFYCPNGHTNYYPQMTDAERFAKERDRAQAALAETRAENAQLLNAKTRLEKRLKAGLCSQCNRHFTNVERHMKAKHKEPA